MGILQQWEFLICLQGTVDFIVEMQATLAIIEIGLQGPAGKYNELLRLEKILEKTVFTDQWTCRKGSLPLLSIRLCFVFKDVNLWYTHRKQTRPWLATGI